MKRLILIIAILLMPLCSLAQQEVPAVRIVGEGGQPIEVKSIGGMIRVSAKDYLYSIARGDVAGRYPMHKFGFNADIGTTEEVLWSRGNTPFPYPTVAQICSVFSDDNDDASTDTGARTIQIYGLDTNYADQNETLTLNGTTRVLTANSYVRIFRGIVRSAGTSGYNEGTISIKAATDSVICEVAAEQNQTLLSLWTVPANHTAYITNIWSTSANSKNVYLYLYVRPYGEVFQNKFTVTLLDCCFYHAFRMPLKIDSKSDIEIRAKSFVGSGVMTAGFDLWYEEN